MNPRMKRALGVLLALSALGASTRALAAPPWVDRGLTLPRHDWSFDLGLGIGHTGPPDLTGAGLNFDFAVGIVRHLELGFRSGARFGADGEATRADQYGRLFDRQTFGTGGDALANPEARVRGELIGGDVFELALEGRVVLPFERGTHFATEFGVPMALHLGRAARLDFGPYVPVVFGNPAQADVSVPFDLWIQATHALWLGPMTGFYIHGRNGGTDVSLGFGLGYSFTSYFDLKTMLLFPAINRAEGARTFGAGVGFEVRIE
jgi:hypothetical protein